ncbi:hypothetical protein BDW74DRAFT_57571 [Aspergillus multicolor]|uniref:uncharacterized protein n=1 Tax=Aspergillus multicolor TaxID=41759 RepID=UPI003CCE33FD
MMITALSYDGYDSSISHGELTAIVTAMRNRAWQPAFFDIDNYESDTEYDNERKRREQPVDQLLFKYEQHFPALLVAILGSHVRINYGCSLGRELVIRQSKLFSFAEFDSCPFELFSRVILSEPITVSEVSTALDVVGSKSYTDRPRARPRLASSSFINEVALRPRSHDPGCPSHSWFYIRSLVEYYLKSRPKPSAAGQQPVLPILP